MSNMIDKDINQQIEQLSRTLHLPAFRGEYQQQAREAAAESLSYEAFLLRLMDFFTVFFTFYVFSLHKPKQECFV